MYSEILKSDSSNADALHLLGLATYQDGRLSEALELVFRAIETRPDAALFYFNAANILRDLNRLEDACRFFRASILLRSDNVDAYVGLMSIEQLREAALMHWGVVREIQVKLRAVKR